MVSQKATEVQFVPWLKWKQRMAKKEKFRQPIPKDFYVSSNPFHCPRQNLSNFGWHKWDPTDWTKLKIPKLASQRTRELYKLKGYPDDWIEKRIRSIAIREEVATAPIIITKQYVPLKTTHVQ